MCLRFNRFRSPLGGDRGASNCPYGQLPGLRRQGLGRGDSFDADRHIGLREALGQKQLDLGVGFALGCGEELAGVVGGQVRGQEHHGTHVKPAIGERRKDRRETQGRACGPDALERGLLRQTQMVNAVLIHGWVSSRRVEPPLIDLGDMSQESCRGGTILCDESDQIAKQLAIAEVGQFVGTHENRSVSRGRT